MSKKIIVFTIFLLLILLATQSNITNISYAKNKEKSIVELVFSRPITHNDISQITKIGGRVLYVFNEINSLAIYIDESKMDLLKTIDGVLKVSPAVKVNALGEELPSVCSVHHSNFTWNLDLINVPTVHETYGLDGTGVYIAVLDTGLEPQWKDYFPVEKIDSKHAAAFMGALATAFWVNGNYNHNAWEADTNGHGTHVVSTIIGFKVYGFYEIDGVAPGATIIPVKVLSNYGWGFSTDVAAGIYYVTQLYIQEKASGGDVLPPEGVVNPIVISMSLGGPYLSPIEEAAINYAISHGVFIVAAAGNEGTHGMSYPGGYEPVISVGAAGWVGEWRAPAWWRASDVPENLYQQVYVTDFSSRELPGQDLDVLAPGSWVVGPYTPYGAAHPPFWANGVPGQYYYLGGTSMATPHVSGILALVLQKDLEYNGHVDLNQSAAEQLFESSTYPITWYSALVTEPYGNTVTISWDTSAVGSGLIQADMVIENYSE